jgi:hypothetical protein
MSAAERCPGWRPLEDRGNVADFGIGAEIAAQTTGIAKSIASLRGLAA